MAQIRQVGMNGFQNALASEDSVDKRRSGASLLAVQPLLTIHRTHFRPLESDQLAPTTREDD